MPLCHSGGSTYQRGWDFLANFSSDHLAVAFVRCICVSSAINVRSLGEAIDSDCWLFASFLLASLGAVSILPLEVLLCGIHSDCLHDVLVANRLWLSARKTTLWFLFIIFRDVQIVLLIASSRQSSSGLGKSFEQGDFVSSCLLHLLLLVGFYLLRVD